VNDYTLRPETPADHAAIHAVELAAFGQPAEADLVDALRAAGDLSLSLVAEIGGTIVGHIAFSPVSLSPAPPRHLRVEGLAPVAVLPAWQGKGIGSALCRAGIEARRAAGVDALVLLGEPAYYSRFGFAPARTHGLTSIYVEAGDAFMVLPLRPGALTGLAACARYAPSFDAL